MVISDSVTVKFDSSDRIMVDGALNVMGTESVLFTRYEPDDEWYFAGFMCGAELREDKHQRMEPATHFVHNDKCRP